MAFTQVRNLLVLMLLLITLFALMGMQLFGGKFTPMTGYSVEPCDAMGCPDPALMEKPRMHFDYFMPSALTTFVVFTGEWTVPIRDAANVNNSAATAFFIIAVFVGRYVIMNFLKAVVLNAFNTAHESVE